MAINLELVTTKLGLDLIAYNALPINTMFAAKLDR